MSKLNNLLEQKLRAYANKTFVIMVNNSIRHLEGSSRSKNVSKKMYVRYDNGIIFGVYNRVEGKYKFVEDPEIGNLLEADHNSTQFLGFDLSQEKDGNKDTLITVDLELKIVHIETWTYRIVNDIVHYVGTQKLMLSKSRETVLYSERMELTTKFLEYSVNAYINTCSSIFLPKIKRMYQLAFYSIDNAFLPLMITNRFLYNPFLQHPQIKTTFAESKIFRECERTVESTGSLRIGYLTQREFCKYMGINNFVGLKWEFAIDLLSGYFLPNICSKYTYQYLLRIVPEWEDDAENGGFASLITEQDYNNLHPEYQEYYGRISTLSLKCKIYARSIPECPINGTALYKYLENYKLLPIEE